MVSVKDTPLACDCELMALCSRRDFRKGLGTALWEAFKERCIQSGVKTVRVFTDTDGFVEPLIPWFLEGGIEGILPLERMAGVDVNRIRQNYPDLFMVGGYDKTVMHKGEAAMRAEFERILPAIRSGAYLPGVDHQTPPDVSMENYAIFVRLLKEYAQYSGSDRK